MEVYDNITDARFILKQALKLAKDNGLKEEIVKALRALEYAECTAEDLGE